MCDYPPEEYPLHDLADVEQLIKILNEIRQKYKGYKVKFLCSGEYDEDDDCCYWYACCHVVVIDDQGHFVHEIPVYYNESETCGHLCQDYDYYI